MDSNNLSFSKNSDNWNEGSTLKYNNKNIGEFQFHKNRDCIKFRFFMLNLINQINNI